MHAEACQIRKCELNCSVAWSKISLRFERPHTLSTKRSTTRFSPALSNAMVSLLPSIAVMFVAVAELDARLDASASASIFGGRHGHSPRISCPTGSQHRAGQPDFPGTRPVPRGLSRVEGRRAILPDKPQPLWVRYGTTAGIVAVSCAVQTAVYAYAGFAGFFLLIPAIFAAGIMYDRGSALFATFASAALAAYLIPISEDWRHAVPLILFVAAGIATAFVSEGLRKVMERLIEEQRAKDVLLRELDHRTKNNMMTMVWLLRIQARATRNPEARAALQAASARIGHMVSQIHSHLEPGSPDHMVSMLAYLEELRRKTDEMIQGRPIVLRLACDGTQLPEHNALPIAIIVNELLTNSLKHAFPDDRAGTIELGLKRDGEGDRHRARRRHRLRRWRRRRHRQPAGQPDDGAAARHRGAAQRQGPGCVTTVRVPV